MHIYEPHMFLVSEVGVEAAVVRREKSDPLELEMVVDARNQAWVLCEKQQVL